MNEEMMKDLPNWEAKYLAMDNNNLSARQKEILKGSPLKSNEGMVFGGMYVDWKRRKGYE